MEIGDLFQGIIVYYIIPSSFVITSLGELAGPGPSAFTALTMTWYCVKADSPVTTEEHLEELLTEVYGTDCWDWMLYLGSGDDGKLIIADELILLMSTTTNW